MTSFKDFTPFTTVTSTSPHHVTISGVLHGTPQSQLPTLLLLHGFPQTHHIWRHVAPQLTSQYNIIIPDLRGYGSSSKPASDVSAYAKSAMAQDMMVMLSNLNFYNPSSPSSNPKLYICAHDRGARVAHKLLVDNPTAVSKCIVLDICPTLKMYESTDKAFATAYWHWFFLIQRFPLPETLISKSPREFADLFMGGRQPGGVGIFGEGYDHYIKNLGDWDTVHAMCQDYRASATVDLEEAKRDIEKGRKVKCPVRVIWGREGVIGKCKSFDGVGDWGEVVEGGEGGKENVEGYAVDGGHYIPEERPDEVVRAVKEFLV